LYSIKEKVRNSIKTVSSLRKINKILSNLKRKKKFKKKESFFIRAKYKDFYIISIFAVVAFVCMWFIRIY